MSTGHPLLSLAMIARDEADNIGDAIASVQSVVGDVVVVLDERTRDNTREIAESYEGAGAIERVKVVDYTWQHHFGEARSESLRHCIGRWIIWLDCDERVEPEDLGNLVTACEAGEWLMMKSTAFVDPSYDGAQEDIQGFGIGSRQTRPRVWRNYVTARVDEAADPVLVGVEDIGEPDMATLSDGEPFLHFDGSTLLFDMRPRFRFRVHEGPALPGGDFELSHDDIDVRVHHAGSDNPFKQDYYYALMIIASRDDPQEAHYAIYLAGRIVREGHPAEALQVLDAADMRTISTQTQLQRYWITRGKILQGLGMLLIEVGTQTALQRAQRYMRMAIDIFGESHCAAGRLHAAVLLIDRGCHDAATQVLREAVTLTPEHLQLTALLGIAEAYLHQPKEMERRVGYCLMAIGQAEDPREAAKRAMELPALVPQPVALSDDDARIELARRKASLSVEGGNGNAAGPSVHDRALRQLEDRKGMTLDLDKLVADLEGGAR